MTPTIPEQIAVLEANIRASREAFEQRGGPNDGGVDDEAANEIACLEATLEILRAQAKIGG